MTQQPRQGKGGLPAQTEGAATSFWRQAIRLGHSQVVADDGTPTKSAASEAKFITGQDPVIITADGGRLPAVPVHEALELNAAKARLEGQSPDSRVPANSGIRRSKDGAIHGAFHYTRRAGHHVETVPDNPDEGDYDNALTDAPPPPSTTNPLFPQLPVYGPPTVSRYIQCCLFRASSAVLSFLFLMAIVLCSAFKGIPSIARRIFKKLMGQNPNEHRHFHEEEDRRQQSREKLEAEWLQTQASENNQQPNPDTELFPPLEGGRDPLSSDAAYYARRVGLDIEKFKVQTEDGFILDLLHVFVPGEYEPVDGAHRRSKTATAFEDGLADEAQRHGASARQYPPGQKRYPVLLMHGLLQSAGAYCCTDDDSLAFYLAKSGYDVWLGNNRCGFTPEHNILTYGDPRMWAWNIRQMGVMDLPALVSRVLEETGFEKLGLVCHSQGTTQTFVALAKEQRPDLGERISVFCALAPAAYSGPLINKSYFKFMRLITPAMFRMLFGIHSFIPFMMRMHAYLPGRLYGFMGYLVFSFLFDWSDARWDRGLRNRLFQFSPVYVSAESMRWWLGRECFAKHKCILSTKAEGRIEDEEDRVEDELVANHQDPSHGPHSQERGHFAWYDERAPPMAFWVCGNDELVDGRRLLRRFDRGREPHVNVVHKKIIEGYEHLDVIWAMDSIELVGKEVREVLWKTADEKSRNACRIPEGC